MGIRRQAIAAAASLALLAPGAMGAGPEPVRLIFDSDICGDCDDVMALAMIHALQSRGECELLAVTVSVAHEQAAPFVQAMNRFYGRNSVPIGYVGDDGVKAGTKYLQIVDTRDGDQARFPHDLARSSDAPAAVPLLRKTLAAQPDGSVTIAQVGFSTNLARLLESKPDGASPLDGTALVARKVKLLSIMAGSFAPISGTNRFLEYNVMMDVPSAQSLVERWPTPIVWSGFEIGIALEYPSESILKDYGYAEHHPVAEAYIAHEPPPHNRPTWDLTSVLVAVRPDRGYFALSDPGRVTVEEDGYTRWSAAAGGRDRYLILQPAQRDRVLEALVLLSSQPPCVADGASSQ